MKEHYCTYEQAVALKRMGFDWKCYQYYIKFADDGSIRCWHANQMDNHNSRIPCIKENVICSAPRLDQAAAWMREKGVYVEPRFQYESVFKTVIQSPKLQKYIVLENKFYSYEEALKYGLDVALELLGKEVNNG